MTTRVWFVEASILLFVSGTRKLDIYIEQAILAFCVVLPVSVGISESGHKPAQPGRQPFSVQYLQLHAIELFCRPTCR